MSHPSVPFHVPFVTGREEDRLKKAIRQNTFGARGPFTEFCTKLIAEVVGTTRVLLTHSCTGALELMALAIGAGQGDEVIVPSYTFSSTAAAFARTGATVRFADIDPRTLCLDSRSVERATTDATIAVVNVGYAGLPGDFEEIGELCSEHGLRFLEDAAQCFGVQVPGGAVGALGDMGAFSFHSTKNIHCGFGGALVVGSEAFDMERIEFIWERGTDRSKVIRGVTDKYTWVEIGSSFSLGELPAAFLSAQLEDLSTVTATRAEIFETYSRELAGLESDGQIRLLRPDSDTHWNYHAAITVFNSQKEADAARLDLSQHGISAYIGYVPLHTSPVGLRLNHGRPVSLPVTERLAPRVLRLPIHTSMSPDDAVRVVDIIAARLER